MLGIRDDLRKKLFQRIGMYIYSDDKMYDATGLSINFLIGIAGLLKNQQKVTHIKLFIDDDYCYFCASGIVLQESITVIDNLFCISKLEDYSFYRNKSLKFLRPIIWVSDNSFVDISNEGENQYKRVYQQGYAVGESSIRRVTTSSKIAFGFNLSKEFFSNDRVSAERMIAKLEKWNKSNDNTFIKDNNYNINYISEFTYSLDFILSAC